MIPGPILDSNGEAMLCCYCGKPAIDGYEYEDPTHGLLDRGGPHWVYCRACDFWTEHPERAPQIASPRP